SHGVEAVGVRGLVRLGQLGELDILDVADHTLVQRLGFERRADDLDAIGLAVRGDHELERDLARGVLRQLLVVDRDREAARHDRTLALEVAVDLVHLLRRDLLAALTPRALAIARGASGRPRVGVLAATPDAQARDQEGLPDQDARRARARHHSLTHVHPPFVR